MKSDENPAKNRFFLKILQGKGGVVFCGKRHFPNSRTFLMYGVDFMNKIVYTIQKFIYF